MTPLNKLITYIDLYDDDIVNQQTIREYAMKLLDEERFEIEEAVEWGWLWRMTGETYFEERFKNNKYHGNTKEKQVNRAETNQTGNQISKVRKATNKKGK